MSEFALGTLASLIGLWVVALIIVRLLADARRRKDHTRWDARPRATAAPEARQYRTNIWDFGGDPVVITMPLADGGTDTFYARRYLSKYTIWSFRRHRRRWRRELTQKKGKP